MGVASGTPSGGSALPVSDSLGDQAASRSRWVGESDSGSQDDGRQEDGQQHDRAGLRSGRRSASIGGGPSSSRSSTDEFDFSQVPSLLSDDDGGSG